MCVCGGGGGGSEEKFLPWGRYGYFLEPHIRICVFNKNLLYLFPAISTSSTVLTSPGSNLTAVPAAIFCQQND